MPPITKNGPRVIAFLQTRQLGVLWMIAVIVGAIVISANPTTEPRRLILPVAVMITYGVVIYNQSSKLIARASQAFQQTIVGHLADSMYFMGFVWTLWALIDSFVLHPNIATGDAIFRTFGYALVTTAFGMFCRLAILQFMYTAAEQEGQAQASVEELLLKFSTTLEITLRTLTEWQEALKTGSQNITEANKTLIATVESTRDGIASTTSAYMRMLATTQERLERLITDVGQHLIRTIDKSIQDGIGNLGPTIAGQLDQIKDATAGLVTTLKRTNTGLGKAIDDLTIKVNNAAIQLGAASLTITNAATHASQTITTTTTTLSTTGTTFAATMKTCGDDITKATSTLAQDMTGLAQQIKNEITLGLTGITITPHVSLVVDETAIKNAVQPVRDDLQHHTDQTQKVQDTLDKKLPTTPATLEDVKSATAKIENDIAGVQRQLQPKPATAEDITRASAKLETLIATITGQLEQLYNEANNRDHKSWWHFGRN